MKKTLLTLLIIAGIVTLSACSDQQSSQEQETYEATTPPQIENNIEEAVDLLTDTKDGIEATISNVRTDGTNTALDITFSNHVYDITSMDVVGLSSLNGVAPTDYIIGDTKMGGHHVEAEMRFPTEAKGTLILGLNEEIIFTFKL